MFTSVLTSSLSSINVVESTLLFISKVELGSSLFYVIIASITGVVHGFSFCIDTFLLSGDPDFLTIGISSGGSLSL